MAGRGFGRIIHISSQQARRPFTANVLLSGFVRTPLNERLSSNPDAVSSRAAQTLIGRNGAAEDFAGAAVFLAGAGSAYVVGQSLAVNGGFFVH